MRIGLYGIYGTYNFGCEAIIRGSVQFLRNIYHDCDIVYFSYSYDYDQRHLDDLDIKIHRIEINKSALKKGVNKILRKLNIPEWFLLIDYKKMLSEVDKVFSIGGDIYTIPAYLRKRDKYLYYNATVKFCEEVIRHGKQVIVYGASVGPFGDYKCAVDYYKKNLSRYSQILCRETKSVEYLNSINVDNTRFLPDPAFLVHADQTEIREKKYIGINLSPLSLNEIYGTYSGKMINDLSHLITDLFKALEIDLLFVPHVLSKAEQDNDYIFLKRIYDNLDDNVKVHVSFADTKHGFLGVKKQLRTCKFVISARMHCAVNAIVENVPSLFLAYSQKSWGMCEYVYGNCKWVIDIKKIHEELIPKVVEMNNELKQLEETIKLKNKSIETQYDDYYKTKIEW